MEMAFSIFITYQGANCSRRWGRNKINRKSGGRLRKYPTNLWQVWKGVRISRQLWSEVGQIYGPQVIKNGPDSVQPMWGPSRTRPCNPQHLGPPPDVAARRPHHGVYGHPLVNVCCGPRIKNLFSLSSFKIHKENPNISRCQGPTTHGFKRQEQTCHFHNSVQKVQYSLPIQFLQWNPSRITGFR